MNDAKMNFLDRVLFSTASAVMLLPLIPYAIAA